MLSEPRAGADTVWRLDRVSQEHRVLIYSTVGDAQSPLARLRFRNMVEIIGQPTCVIAADNSWFFVADSGTRTKKAYQVGDV